MRKAIVLVLFLLSNYNSLSQDVNNNLRVYNVTQFTVSKISDATLASSRYSMAYTYDDPKSLGINMNFGYFVLPHHIGIGVSLGINTNFNPNFNLFPLGFELRYLVFNQPSTPYLFCQMRSLVKIGEDFYGGRERGFGLGYKVKLAHATFLTFDLKYNYKTIKNGEGMYASNLSIKGLDFSLGMIF